MKKKKFEKEIGMLQMNLGIIRKLGGWSPKELGDMIGSTKQTIFNLENMKTPMSLTQYIAIRSLIDHAIELNPTDKLLSKSVDILVNNSDAYKPDDLSEIRDNLIVIAAAKSAGITNDSASTFLSSSKLSEKISSVETDDTQIENWKNIIWA